MTCLHYDINSKIHVSNGIENKQTSKMFTWKTSLSIVDPLPQIPLSPLIHNCIGVEFRSDLKG